MPAARIIPFEIGQMPPALLGFFVALWGGPIAFWAVIPLSANLPFFGLSLIALGLLPLALSLCLVKKSLWFYPLFLSHCVGLGLHLFALSFEPIVHVYMVVLMVYMAGLVGSRQLLYPMMTRDTRLWRQALRYRIGKRIQIQKGEIRRGAFLEDCSETGVAISFGEGEGFSLVVGEHFRLEVCTDSTGTNHEIPLVVVWSAPLPNGDTKLGCESLDRTRNRSYLEQEAGKAAAAPLRAEEARLDGRVRKTAMTLWLVSAFVATLV